MFKDFRFMEHMWALADSMASDRKQDAHENLPRFGPLEGKDLHPACLILYCLYIWSCYNGAHGRGRKRWRVLAYARGIYARSDAYARLEIDLSWPPLLALIWGRGLGIQSKSVTGICEP
jgi:hypothetical protein